MEQKPKIPYRLTLAWSIVILLAVIFLSSYAVQAWLGSEQSRLLSEGGWNIYSLDRLNSSIVQGDKINTVTKLAEGLDKQIWVGTDNGLYRFDGTTWHNSLNEHNVISELTIDVEGQVWVYSYNGLQIIKDEQVNYANISRDDGDIHAMATDKNGQVWIAESDSIKGIAPISRQGIGQKLPDSPEPISPFVINKLAFAPDGKLWVGHDGVNVYDGLKWQDYNKETCFTCTLDPTCQCGRDLLEVTAIIFDAKNNTWVSGRFTHDPNPALFLFDGHQWTRQAIPYPTNQENIYISALAFDAKDRLWVAFNQQTKVWVASQQAKVVFGLGMYDGNKWAFYQTQDIVDPLISDNGAINTLLIDKQERLWLGVGPKLVSIDLQSNTLPATDPVPHSILTRQQNNDWLIQGSSLLAVGAALVAFWFNYLNSPSGRAWEQQLQSQDDTPPEFTESRFLWLFMSLFGSLFILFCGIFGYNINGSIMFFNKIIHLQQISDLIPWIIMAGLPVGSALMIHFGNRGVNFGRTPTIVLVSKLSVLIGKLILILYAFFLLIAFLVTIGFTSHPR